MSVQHSLPHASSDSGRFETAGSGQVQVPRLCEGIVRNAHRKFIFVAYILITVFIIWAGTTKIDSVTRGSGSIVPTHQNQMVQHLEGGIIADILIEEGEAVKKGDILMRITDSLSSSEREQAELDLLAMRLQQVRLETESRGGEVVSVPEGLQTEAAFGLIDNERKLFERRKSGLVERVRILEDQSRQRELELAEKKSRLESMQEELKLAQKRVDNLKRLNRLGAVSQNELLSNQTALQRLKTSLGDLEHQIPQTEAALSETIRRRNEEILRFRSEAEGDLVKTRVRIAKLQEAVRAMQDRKQRTDIRAPMDGTVNKIFIPTLGGVVRPGQPVVEIVPHDSSVTLEARLSPKDRANVWPGLPCIVKVSAYDFSIYGGLKGKIVDISPDAFKDDGGEPYFRVRIEADSSSFGKDNPVVPGMLAEVDILTSKHTVLSYLLKPLYRVKEKALRQ